MTKLVSHLTTTKESEAEAILLKAYVCPGEIDPAGCIMGVERWWPMIAMAIRLENEVCLHVRTLLLIFSYVMSRILKGPCLDFSATI